jgi:hypothetical protein
LSNIQARDKLKAAKGKLRDARAARSVTAEYEPQTEDQGPIGGGKVTSPSPMKKNTTKKKEVDKSGRNRFAPKRFSEDSEMDEATLKQIEKQKAKQYKLDLERSRKRLGLGSGKKSAPQAAHSARPGSAMIRRKPKSADSRSYGEEVEMIDEATLKSKDGSQLTKSGKKVPAKWRKMGKDEVSDRVRTHYYTKKPGIKRTYSTGTSQPKGPDKAKKKQMGTERKPKSDWRKDVARLSRDDEGPRQTGPIGGGKTKTASPMRKNIKPRYDVRKGIDPLKSKTPGPKNPRGVPADHQPPKRVEPKKGGVATHTPKAQPDRKGKVKKVPSNFSPVRRRSAAQWKGQTTQRRDTKKEQIDYSPLIAATLDELSKATLGSYVKKASHSAVDHAMALQRTADKNQTPKDVEKHAGKVVRRQGGISKATDKLSKEDMSLAPKGKGRKAAKRMYGEDISIVDTVQEVLGLGNKWKGMEKMPKTDPNKKTSRGTDAYVTGKSKIQRLPKKEDVEMEATGQKKGSAKLKKGWKMRPNGSVYYAGESVEMDEKNWIKGAIKKPGALHRDLDVPQGEKIPASKLATAAKKDGKVGQRARLAQTLKKMHNEYEID